MYTTPPGHWGNTVYLNLRSTQPAGFLVPLLRSTVASISRELPLKDIRTLNQVVQKPAGERGHGPRRRTSSLALGLVAVGLYGTLSYHIVQRTREIGVRLAIGALSGDILRLVLGQGLRWVAFGLLLGLTGTFALTTVLKGLVYDMEGLTLPPLLLAAAVVACAATLAILIPAWRASRLDPLAALRID